MYEVYALSCPVPAICLVVSFEKIVYVRGRGGGRGSDLKIGLQGPLRNIASLRRVIYNCLPDISPSYSFLNNIQYTVCT